MKLFVQLAILFLAITGATTLLMGQGDIQFGNINFWDNHGIALLFFITLFPRLTLVLSSIPFGGLLWWLGFFFAPRLLVACLATVAYWNTNPILVVISWFVAISGESAEKWGFNKQFHFSVGGRSFGQGQAQRPHQRKTKVEEDVIDAEFRRMDD
tara:strand:+ start:465 stop:929 length:465 start_codon:yes stop_codon:yes gene_type:complete